MVNTILENASNKVSVEHLYDKEKSVEMDANLHETDKGKQTSPTKFEEKPEITTQTGEHAMKEVDYELPV